MKSPEVGDRVIYYSDDLGGVEGYVVGVLAGTEVNLALPEHPEGVVEAIHYTASPGRIDYTWHWPEESKLIWPDFEEDQ